MLLWTVLPEELVLEQAGPPPVYEETDIAGTRMLVERVPDGRCRIVRLYSTDPRDFLRPELQPGTLVNYKPVIGAN